MRRVLLALVVLLVSAPSAQAISAPTLRGSLDRAMRGTSVFSGAYVRDLATGRTLFSAKPDVPRTPASVEKLYTTATALLRFGPDATLRTSVLGQGAIDQLGVWRGDLYLRGGGDPTLGAPQIEALAEALGNAGIVRVAGSILGDESRFDVQRGSYDTGGRVDPDMDGVLGALVVGRGFTKDGRPAAQAAIRLAKALRANGIAVDGPSGAGTTPPTAQELAGVDSPPMRDLIAQTNVPSDNFLAEMLVKGLGSAFGGAGTTAAGTAVVRDQMATFGIHPTLLDGSGLSRADRTTPREVVRLLERMHGQPVAGAFEGSLPVVGRTGTLRKRMRGTAAQDRCRAKTGTLIGVSTLAGVCDAAGGHTIAFALMMGRASVTRAHAAQDRMTAAIAKYDGP
jgi:D-alanyl-D-alanine carboxypeptidase/D-alanyl-D-alanine-endopeptidase (penicillin-binding protein 4)